MEVNVKSYGSVSCQSYLVQETHGYSVKKPPSHADNTSWHFPALAGCLGEGEATEQNALNLLN